MDNITKLQQLKSRLLKIESELSTCRTSVMQDGWQTQRHVKKSRKWDILAQRKMELIKQIDEIEYSQSLMEDSHKKATEMIIKLQNKNAQLRIAILKLTTLCDRTKQHLVSEIWAQQIGYAKQIIEETEK